MKLLVPILWTFLVSAAFGHPTSEFNNAETDFISSIANECLQEDPLNCFKRRLISELNEADKNVDNIPLANGVTVFKTSKVEEGAPRSIDSNDMDTALTDRLTSFLRTHSIKVDLKGSDILGVVESAGRSLEDFNDNVVEGRGKKKKAQKIMGPLMMAMALKVAAILPIVLGSIALIAGKALLVGKIALVISAIIGLKKLLGGQQKHVTYEVVAHPHHSSSHSVSHDDGGHGGGGGFSGGDFGGASSYGGSSSGHGWARSLPQDVHQNAQKMAYSAHLPTTKA